SAACFPRPISLSRNPILFRLLVGGSHGSIERSTEEIQRASQNMCSTPAGRRRTLRCMDRVFAAGGTLAPVLPGCEPRAEQARLGEAVARALAREEHLLAEAGTGTGKSLGYLIPALESGRRVVVATATKALQEQLLTKDVPAAAAALGRDGPGARRHGPQDYPCL